VDHRARSTKPFASSRVHSSQRKSQRKNVSYRDKECKSVDPDAAGERGPGRDRGGRKRTASSHSLDLGQSAAHAQVDLRSIQLDC
jgi:hypothetical protein